MGVEAYKTHTEPPVKMVSYKNSLHWEAITTLEGLKKVLGDHKRIAFDTETNSLDYYKASIAGFSISTDGVNGYYIPIGHKQGGNAPREALDYIVEWICNDSHTTLMWNKKYDLNILEISCGYELGIRWNVKDVQALVWLRDTDFTFPSLKWASLHFLGIEQPRFDEVAGETTFDYVTVEESVEYAALDAICTFRLAMVTMQSFPNLQNIFQIDDRSLEVLRKLEHNKIRVDMSVLKNENESVAIKMQDLKKRIYKYAGHEFNVNSAKQVAEALLKAGVILTDKTPKGAYSTKADVLEKLEHPMAALMVEHNKWATYMGTFIKNFIAYTDDEGIRFNYKTCGVVTGRLASGGDKKNSYYAGFNAQNIPKPFQADMAAVPDTESPTGWSLKSIEDIFELNDTYKGGVAFDKNIQRDADGNALFKVAYDEVYIVEAGSKKTGQPIRAACLPYEDSQWVSIDYAGQELRIAANFSNEPTFIDAFLNGGDPHMETAKKIWGEGAGKNERRNAKGANFALQYGGTDYTLQGNLGMSAEAAKAFYDAYCKAMPTLINWQTYMKKMAKSKGTVYSALGRPFQLGRFFGSGVKWVTQSAGERFALNYPIQGTGGDIIRIALTRVLKYWDSMRKHNVYGFELLSTVHDEINFSVRNGFLNTFMDNVPEIMTIRFPEWKIPLEVGVDIGPNWCEAFAYKYNTETKIYTPKGDLIVNNLK